MISGDKKLLRKLQALAESAPEATAAALYQEALGVMASAVKKAPVEFGVLRNSAYTSPPTKRKGEAVVEVGFGTNYGAFQHERTGLKHPRGGQAKYLQAALNEARTGYLERLGKRIMSNIKNDVKLPVLAAPQKPNPPPSKGKKTTRRKRRR
jgi:hypothetical protein